jgi:hypothetical protein
MERFEKCSDSFGDECDGLRDGFSNEANASDFLLLLLIELFNLG